MKTRNPGLVEEDYIRILFDHGPNYMLWVDRRAQDPKHPRPTSAIWMPFWSARESRDRVS